MAKTSRTCSRCPLETTAPGQTYCLACRKEYHAERWKAKTPEQRREYNQRNRAKFRKHVLKKKFGLTLEGYDALLQKQGGVCAICNRPETSKTKQHLSVDHDHETGVIRGLLCLNCNTALGKLGDSPELLRRALDYLEQAR